MARFLIIAASSAIGQALSNDLKADGHEIVTTARDTSRIKPDMVLDATDFDAVDAAFVEAGALDGAVNCSGSLWLKPAHLTSREQYDAVISASLTTAFATVRAAGKRMTAGGCVVLVSSAAAETGLANHEAIAAAKAGVLGLMRSAAATYAPNNLRFNAIAPGLIESPLTSALVSTETGKKISEAMHPLGRIGAPQHAARAIAFLLDPRNDWITGQVLGVDGGLAHVRPKVRI